MKTPLLATLLGAVLCATAWAQDAPKFLTEAELKKVITGAHLSGVNEFGNPYITDFLPSGEMTGKAGFADEYVDKGTWWIDGDRYCRQWEEWFDAKPACFSVALEGQMIKFYYGKKLIGQSKYSMPAKKS